MKEIRVYIVYDDSTKWMKCSNEEFMRKAESEGTVYSLAGFVHLWNEDWLAAPIPEMSSLRIIEVEDDESINFEKWDIPKVKLNR